MRTIKPVTQTAGGKASLAAVSGGGTLVVSSAASRRSVMVRRAVPFG